VAGAALCTLCLLSLALAEGPGPDGRQVAVTFDDLPVISVTEITPTARREITANLLAALARQRVAAVGFVNEYALYGYARQPGPKPDPLAVALLEMWLDSGFELGNHGFAHADLHAVPVAAYTEDIMRGDVVTKPLAEAHGKTLRYFRPPYLHTGRALDTRRQVEEFLRERGYRVAPVTVDNEDYMFAAAYSRAAASGDRLLMNRVAGAYIEYSARAFAYSEHLSALLFGRQIPHVLLLHANALNAECFDRLADMMRGRGYSFVTLDEALRDPAYDSPNRYVGAEAINWLGRWAITRGIRTEENVLDDFPDVPAFVTLAAKR
jgi:peptidoglycan/xylan/chitin deacetylase (PgdA/CDA1 family)